jgi:hypothetical protein
MAYTKNSNVAITTAYFQEQTIPLLETTYTTYYVPSLFGSMNPAVQAFKPTDKDKLTYKNVISKIDLSGKEIIDVLLYTNAAELKTSMGMF